jgi:large subunit ribosomal protein L21
MQLHWGREKTNDMSLLAIIKTGGKQYLVREGQELRIEKLENESGESVEFDALLLSEEDGSQLKIGNPIIGGARVSAKVKEQGRADKVSVIKYKPKVRYRRNVGHRQPFTLIQIIKIAAS